MRQASCEVSDVIAVRVEMRPPKKGEIGWCVDADLMPTEALADVLKERDTLDVGAYGYGWVAENDQPEYDRNHLGEITGRNITIIAEPVRTHTGTLTEL
jgi:hypothetical protein